MSLHEKTARIVSRGAEHASLFGIQAVELADPRNVRVAMNGHDRVLLLEQYGDDRGWTDAVMLACLEEGIPVGLYRVASIAPEGTFAGYAETVQRSGGRPEQYAALGDVFRQELASVAFDGEAEAPAEDSGDERIPGPERVPDAAAANLATAPFTVDEMQRRCREAGGAPNCCPACNRRSLEFRSGPDDMARFNCSQGCDGDEVLRMLDTALSAGAVPGDEGEEPLAEPDRGHAKPSRSPVDQTDEEWPTPRSLAPRSLPPFPLDAFPPNVADFVSATATETQTPVDAVGGAVLSVASIAAGDAVELEVRPGWREVPGLYVTVVLGSGERKSAILDHVGRPLRDLERELMSGARDEVREACARADSLEARRRALLRTAEVDPAEVVEIDAELERLRQVRMPRVLTDDATTEALAKLLADHGRIGVLSAEGAFLANALGRYSDGNAKIEVHCKAYSGEPVTVDRRGDDPLYLERPQLALGLFIQPAVLGALRANPAARGQGLVPRFAFLVPETLVGRRDTNPPTVPAALADRWDSTVRAIFDLRGEPGFCRLCRLSDAAATQFARFCHEHEPRLLAGSGDLAAISDWGNRHPGRVARIALLLHLLSGRGPGDEIEAEIVTNAIRIGEVLSAHAVVALDADGTAQARRVVRWIAEEHREEAVTVRQLHRGPCGGGNGSKEPAERAVADLVARGLLRKLPKQSGAKGGQPAERYAIHPRIADALCVPSPSDTRQNRQNGAKRSES